MNAPSLPAIQPATTTALHTFRSHDLSPLKITSRARSDGNSSTGLKITKYVTPLHHDPMVINFGRWRRPNLTGETTP